MPHSILVNGILVIFGTKDLLKKKNYPTLKKCGQPLIQVSMVLMNGGLQKLLLHQLQQIVVVINHGKMKVKVVLPEEVNGKTKPMNVQIIGTQPTLTLIIR